MAGTITHRCEPPADYLTRPKWHWVELGNGKLHCAAWDGDARHWNWLGGTRTAEDAAAAGWRYMEPVATPAEGAAKAAGAAHAAAVSVRERAALIADDETGDADDYAADTATRIAASIRAMPL